MSDIDDDQDQISDYERKMDLVIALRAYKIQWGYSNSGFALLLNTGWANTFRIAHVFDLEKFKIRQLVKWCKICGIEV